MNRLRWLAVLALTACGGPEVTACEDTCETLVSECGFEAFPTRESCVDGCLQEASNDGAVQDLSLCTYEADCDPFETMLCARLAVSP